MTSAHAPARSAFREYVVAVSGRGAHQVRIARSEEGYVIMLGRAQGGGETVLRVDSRRVDHGRETPGDTHSNLLIEGRSCEARVREEGGGRYLVQVSGETFPVEVQNRLAALVHRAEASRQRAAEERVVSPMPGLVVALEVSVGQVVEPGRPVVIVEAMKMQNELPTLHGGRVREILVKRGDVVDSGQALLVLEPAR